MLQLLESTKSVVSTSHVLEILLAVLMMMKRNCKITLMYVFSKVYCFYCRVRAVEVPCVLNIAAVKLRFKDYDEAIYECNKILEIEVRILQRKF